MKQSLLAFFLLFLSCVKSLSQNKVTPVYAITSDSAYISIPDSCWQMMEDKEGNWTISQASQSPLSENFQSKTKIQSSTSSYWVRFWLKNDLDHDAYIYFNSYGQIYDLYIAPTASSWQHQRTGLFVPWSKRDGVKNRYWLPIIIGPSQELLVYERFK